MRILIACEHSGVARLAFEEKGHDVWSCDMKEYCNAVEDKKHYIGDVTNILNNGWDMMIAFPPLGDIGLIKALGNANIEYIAIENPSSCLRKALGNDGFIQVLNPYLVDHHINASALWLKHLPIVTRKYQPVGLVRKITRTKDKLITDSWLAKRMAEQWG